ncbi:hypothetical protein G6F24_017929 [Rhizopus arrhizus]|nr:hypothetical protein G6F24_017929 [Rhizopus arrhizus]
MRLVLGMVDDAVQFGVEQRAPGRMLGMLVNVVADAEHRDRQQRQVAQQPPHHAPVQRARLTRLHRLPWPDRWPKSRPGDNRPAAACGSACRQTGHRRCGAVRRHANATGLHPVARRPTARTPAAGG